MAMNSDGEVMDFDGAFIRFYEKHCVAIRLYTSGPQVCEHY